MFYQLVQTDDNKVLLYVIIIAFIFFTYVLPELEKCYARESAKMKEQMESLMSRHNHNLLKMDKKTLVENFIQSYVQ